MRLTALATALLLPAAAMAAPPEPAAVVDTYANVAQAMFEDATSAARDLSAAVDALLANPGDDTLKAARAAWIAARPWYSRTEALRFGNKRVDDFEGKVNSWPLDEGLIDYVDTASYGETSDENPLYRANVIANTKLRIGKKQVDATKIDRKLLAETLQQAGGVEANVATGYHAVEFLLWGQDLNGTKPGAGNRPATDFSLTGCTHGHCDRRRDYLKVATDLLVDDLAVMAAEWKPGGPARKDLLAKGANGGLATILTGIGSLSYGELAGERMKLGVILHDTEEEQDCFSDNTANEPVANQDGMIALVSGKLARRDGSKVEGPGLLDLATAKAPDQAAKLVTLMEAAKGKLVAIQDKAASGMAWDQMLASGNAEGNKLILDGVEALVAQTHGVEALVGKLGLKISLERSDSLDNPGKVQAK